MTIFVCGKTHFAFERDRSGLKGLDWRNQEDVLDVQQQWKPFSLTKKQSDAVSAFLLEMKVDWGRLDFLRKGSKLVFLEYNANGQFLFLDLKNEFGILDRVAEYLLEKIELPTNALMAGQSVRRSVRRAYSLRDCAHQ